MHFTAGSVAHAADLEMRIIWQGTLPKVPWIENPFKRDCQGVDLNAGRQFVDSETRGVRDAVVYVSPLRRDQKRWQQPPRNKIVRLDVEECRIRPHIVTAQSGDRLHAVHRDEAAIHNLNFSFFANSAIGANFRVSGEPTRELRSPEPAPIPIECNIHPWEKAFLFVLEHSYIGVSDREGRLLISGLPRNSDIPLRFFHEYGTIHSVRIDGERRQLKHGRLSIRVTEPMTAVREVVINAESFIEPKLENE